MIFQHIKNYITSLNNCKEDNSVEDLSLDFPSASTLQRCPSKALIISHCPMPNQTAPFSVVWGRLINDLRAATPVKSCHQMLEIDEVTFAPKHRHS
ncbi:hypothetical protein AVEN_149483-1 [Araneus ventricosus]|uniref:Uncharacterized protein n=1 Tax=Araneus ventricosus TaxID=182803 RepID=A0A4Y2RCU1_ARAVE|nr:hypothetical protein AVEN_97736-1 [Araneus ventricosus]GBN73608.1 hypothetical protein AVEN_2101-1 [Araneus ventricosus]GBN76265.1 hypothetical protein AVEN_176846-1 [Araneus ventricosus]GBN77323.1 hypothetical protein AVEN_45320-1 [Araneus ventricosus]GBN77333.1 hypothetical protein AVEN_149483-1 [Araneus ventricosus]